MSWFGGGSATTPAQAPAATVAPFNFGLGGTQAAASTTPATGFGGFGMTTPAAPSQAFSFGTAPQPAASPVTGGFGLGGFGQTAAANVPASAPSFGFGSSTGAAPQAPVPAQTTPFSFGLGSTAVPAAGGIVTSTPFGFGTSALASTVTSAPSFGIGTTAPVTSTPSFGFGTSAAVPITSAPSFGFGTAAPVISAPSSFGIGTATAPVTSTPSFGIGTTTPVTSTPSFGFGAPAPASSLSSSLGIGATAPVTSTPFGIGTTAPVTSTPSFGFGTAAPATSVPSFGIGAIPPVSGNVTSAPSVGGLGGMTGSSINSFGMGAGVGVGYSSGSSSGGRGDQRSVKELPIPAELLVLVEELKTHMKNEKVTMTEVSRASYRTTEHVTNALDETRSTILNISNIIQRQSYSCEAFRQQITQDVRDAEMAQMTRETPLALQADNYLPTEYFFRILADYENRMLIYKREIRKAESAIAALDSNTPVNAKDLCMSLKSVRDSLVSIAAKVKTLHERVTAEVETHQNLLRFVQGDTGRDIFAERAKDQFNRWDQKSSEATSGVLFPSRITDPARLYMNYMAGAKESSSFNNLIPGSPTFGRPLPFSPSGYPPAYGYGGYGSTTLYQSPSSQIFNPYSVTSPPHSAASALKRTKH